VGTLLQQRPTAWRAQRKDAVRGAEGKAKLIKIVRLDS
jgi:hypothetical protein